MLVIAKCAIASERTTDMTDMRRCIGSKTYGIVAHEAPASDFPTQPSQKDGLGRMCRSHWNAYTTALRKASLARKAAEEPTVELTVHRLSKVEQALAVAGKPKAPKPESTPVRNAKSVVAATETLAGKAYTDAVGSDEVQAALAVLGSRGDASDPADTSQEETPAS